MTTQTTNPTPGTEFPTPAQHPKLLELLPKLSALETALLAKDPKMPEHLREIHKYLIQFEELAHLLNEEQIAVILRGNQVQTGVILAAETTKTRGNKVKAGKIDASDL